MCGRFVVSGEVSVLNWLSPALEVRPDGPHGAGVFARVPVRAGTTMVAFGGRVRDGAYVATLPPRRRSHCLQVDDDLYLVGADEPEPGDFVNHSCDPSCGVVGSMVLVALRDLSPGDEVTFDYAMTDSTPYDEFTCGCGTERCRGRVGAHDWERPELQVRYDGWFSGYLQRRIDGRRATASDSVA
jgi:SET domain-containing protein